MIEATPTPVPPLTLAGRWVLRQRRSQDALGVWHAADDLTLERTVQIFQLAPAGTECGEGRTIWPKGWPADLIRSVFREEILQLQRLRISAMRRIYEVFEEGETIWVAQSIEGARVTQLDHETGAKLLVATVQGLAPLHQRGRLLLPSSHSWAITSDGLARFRMAGLTQAWVADAFSAHEQFYDIQTTPPELMQANVRRGPGTDVYLVAASLARLMTGLAPQEALDQLPSDLRDAIARCLDPRLDSRPQDGEELLGILSRQHETAAVRAWKQLDQKRKMLHMLRVEPMACPACHGVLERPDPLPPGRCPACTESSLERRRLEPRLCPCCRVGILQRWEASDKPIWCPTCETGHLSPHKSGLARRLEGWICSDCESLVKASDAPDWADINQKLGRTAKGWECDVCSAQLDELDDGRWRRMTEDTLHDGWTTLWPDEWSRVAVGLPPDAGGHQCPVCGSAYHQTEDSLTLCECPMPEPSAFVRDHMDQRLTMEAAARLAVGLEEQSQQLVCPSCRTAFAEEEELRLTRTSHPLLRPYIGESKTLPNWRRTALDLPETGQEEDLDEDLRAALAESYRAGRLDLNSKREDLVWDGAGLLHSGRRPKPVRLTVFRDHIRFRIKIRQRRIELDDIVELRLERETSRLIIECSDGDQLPFEVEPSQWDVMLPSGKFSVMLTAADLAVRLRREIRGQTKRRSDAGRAPLAAETHPARSAD